MFEKSLYDLIRGLRHHKGKEKEYIQASLRECRKEIKGQDMALKATALMKLTYLEMFGHDMSWASFHVLEVMSSANYVEKKVGYLAAVQSFRPDTEVLMLAENLLKKDLTSANPLTISLPLGAIPHVISPSMANSLLSDLLPRLTHSHAAIRKKTIVTLYRLALVYPETLRPAWPKIKERLQDEEEDPSVTSAIINVVCELGWRRPQDFLPLAPRLFDLLVDGGNNWMAIKIIKLFATLTPLEPRLIKKLLPPLTTIIKTTPAMSLLYECIHGIVQGGILESVEGTTEGEEVARLCVGKLRSMLVVEGDPNLKYVALLAFEKIVNSHPHLVSLHQDVILECIDDADITIRTRALHLVVGMVSGENLTAIVDRLLKQLLASPMASAAADEPLTENSPYNTIEPQADSDDEDAEESLRQPEVRSNQLPPLPDDYRIQVIQNILDMCSKDTYSNLNDFEWYIDVLVKLVKACPMVKSASSTDDTIDATFGLEFPEDVSYKIGNELRNIAVRVKNMRSEATAAAQSLVLIDNRETLFPSFSNGGLGVLEACGWIVGEYADLLTDPNRVLNSILHSSSTQLPPKILFIYLQAMLKAFSNISGDQLSSWTPQRRTNSTLLMARIIYFLEPLAKHPDLQVQELSVEYLELMRLASEASSGQPVAQDEGEFADPPLLLTQAIPALFVGMELNPVAAGAQRKVQAPADLDLETPINENLQTILGEAENDALEIEHDDFDEFYYQPVKAIALPESAADRLDLAAKADAYSYQYNSEDDRADPAAASRKRAERRERNKDDPFYIGSDDDASASSRMHNIIKNANGEDLDIDSIPIMDLNLESQNVTDELREKELAARSDRQRKAERRKNIQIIVDETLDEHGPYSTDPSPRLGDLLQPKSAKGKKALLHIDSSGLGTLSLEGGSGSTQLDIEQRQEEERALREVERLRLEMQRASERIQAREETVVRKKKKKKTSKPTETSNSITEADPGGEVVVKKKKKKKVVAEDTTEAAEGETGVVNPKKKKKKRQVDLRGPEESLES